IGKVNLGPRPSPSRVVQKFIAHASPSGFVPELVLMATGTPVPKSTIFGAPQTIVEGQVSGPAQPAAADVPAVAHQFDLEFTVTASRGHNTVGDYQVVVTLAVEVSLDGGQPSEVATRTVYIWLFDGESDGATSGSIRCSAVLEGGDDAVYLHLKDVFTRPSDAVGFLVTATAKRLRWTQDAAVRYADATPGGEDDAIPFVLVPEG